MSANKQPESDSGEGTSTVAANSATITAAAVSSARGVVMVTKDASHERNADRALWLLNNLHTPLTFSDMENPYYHVIDIIADVSTGRANGPSGGGSMNSAGSRHPLSHIHQQHRSTSYKTERQASHSMLSTPVDDISLLEESLDRKYKFTEETVFWTLNHEYNVVFVIDMSQSMYSLDPNTNNTYIQTALETLEKCLMGMIQPFAVRSMLGLPDYVVEPHICASVIGYCPRPPGSYPSEEEDRKTLPFCRTMAHAHMVTSKDMSDFIKLIRNFLFNYERELQDMLGSFPPPPPPIPFYNPSEPENVDAKQRTKRSRHSRKTHNMPSFESFRASGKAPQAGDAFAFTCDPDAPLLHSLQIADYFLKILPEICSSVFVYLTDGVVKSHFNLSKAQTITSSLVRRNTQCTFIQVGSCGGFTPESSLGFVGDNEMLFYLAASLGGRFVYASDCPDSVPPHQANFYHQVMLVRETRIARTPVRNRYDHILYGGRRLGDLPRERLNTNRDCGLQATQSGDSEFPWRATSKPPVVETVVSRYTDYNTPVNMGALIEARMNEGFSIRTINVTKFDRDGPAERVDVNLELVWQPNVTIIYRIKNMYYIGSVDNQKEEEDTNGSSSRSTPRSPDKTDDRYMLGTKHRSQRSSNQVEIVIRAYSMFTLVFLRSDYGDRAKGGIFAKVLMIHDFLKSISDKDEDLKLIYSLPQGSLGDRTKLQPPVFVPPTIKTNSGPLPTYHETIPLASRICTEEIDTSVFLKYTNWGVEHYHVYDVLNQLSKNSDNLKSLASFTYTTSVFIDTAVISSYVEGINFTETAKHGQRILSDFRAHVCQAGTWALLRDPNLSVVFLQNIFRQARQTPAFIVVRWEMATNWILRVSFALYNGTVDSRKIVMDCLPTFSESFCPEYIDLNRDSVVRAIRPLHLLPMDFDIVDKMPPSLLSTRDIGNLHTYVVEWRWTYLAREGTREDLSGEGSDSEIVRQALHRLAMALGYHRLAQDFTLINAKGESTGLTHAPDASKYDSCITFYHEREGYDCEELLLACQYQIVVDMKQSSVTARTWIEPWSARFLRMLFEDDFRLLAPLGTFQQILQPERCFQLKVPNLAEFHSKRMNMFSIMAVVNSSRIGLRMLQLPDVSPAYAVWNHPDGIDDIKVDDPTFEITLEPDPDDDLEIQILNDSGKITDRIMAKEYYKTHDREETCNMAKEKKLLIVHRGTTYGERRAILLERFMLTLIDKKDEGKYDPYIEKYRLNEYNPFILALINPGHPRKLFFSKLSIKWMTTGEFTMVAHRCFLEFALFKHCDAISVNAERFNKLRFANSIVSELMEHSPGVHQATGVPNGLDEHLYMDKWFVIRLPNNTSFLMVILPNVPLSAPNRHIQKKTSAKKTQSDETKAASNNFAASQSSEHASSESKSSAFPQEASGHRRQNSEPASPPVFTPALKDSILGDRIASSEEIKPTAINAYTLVMECSMDNTEMRRQVRTMDFGCQAPAKTKLNLRQLDVPCNDTRVLGDCFQGFVGQKDIPVPFTDYALEKIKKLERMYSEASLQTIYLALLLKRHVSHADLVASQKSTLWEKKSIDVDITAFLHSQDVARISRDIQWQAADRQSLQEKFMDLLSESFTPLPVDVDPSQGRYYYCKSTPDKRSELEICLQLAQNPLFINLQCSVEVLDGDMGHEKRLNMPIDKLPLSLELLCEHAGIPWRPPTDHFEPLEGVRVILHINCLYLPDEDLLKTTLQEHDVEAVDVELTKILQQKPDKRELENRAAQLFQETMSLSSLVDKSFDPVTIVSESGAANKDMDLLPSAVVAKQHINAQMATLKGLPHDQLELVRHCHRRFVRFIAQETLYALRDIIPATVPLLNQVWHTIATTVDEDVPSDKFEFSQNKLDLRFVIDMPDVAKRRHAVQLVMSELLKQDGAQPNYPLGKLEELGGIVYMRDVRSRSARIEASARMRARALSDTHYVAGARKADGVKEYINTGPEDLTDAIPSWFLIKPTSNLDGVRILTHNYSIVTNEVADNVLAAIRQRLMVALKAANTRLLLEELAETHRFPDLLVLPDAARAKLLHRSGSTRLGSQSSDQHTMRDGAISIAMQQSYNAQSSTAQSTTGAAVDDRAQRTNWPRDVHSPANTPAATSFYPGPSSRNPFNIASILKPYIPDSPEFYSCDEQFTHVFPLHPRISPPRAAQAVLASGMMNNRLVNQRNMFFVRDGSSIFYALLTIDRIPYVNPFGINRPSRGPKAAISLSSVPGQAATFTSPLYSTDAIMPGAHTIATTSPNATVYESYRNGSRTLLDPSIFQTSTDTTSSSASASHAQVGGTFGDDIRRRSPLIPPIGGTERGGFLSHVVSTPAMTSRGMDSIISASADGAPVSPRIGGSETALMGGNRYSLAEAVTSHHSVSATPESPSNRYLGSLLTNLEESNLAAGSSRRRVADPPRSPVISQRDGSIHAQPTSYIPQPDEARLPLGASDRRLTETQNFEADVGGRMTQFLSNVNTPNIDSLAHNDGTAIAHAEERSVPCIVLHIYGVDKPSKEMTKSLVQQIRERITVHVTMPEMSDMLLRRVALNDHDMDFLFPMCNPEPVILYMPLPRFVHDVDKLILYFRQALGEIISPFPPSDLLAKAIRRSFNHLRRRHSDDGGFRSRTGINTQVPNSLRDDIIRLMDGWEYDQQIPGRVPFEKLVYLYNFYTKSGAPPPEMTDIGTGIAIVAALPLTRERTLPKRIWESLVPQADSSMQQEALGSGGNSGLRPETQAQNADDVLTMASDAAHRTSQSSVHRRAASYFMDVVSNALTPNQQQPSNLSPAQQTSKLFQRRASHTPSLHDNQQQQSSHSSSAASLLDDGECSSVSDNSRNSETHGADGARPNNYEATRTIPPSEIAKLFSEYLRQFKEAHAYLRLEASDYANIEELMDNQVKEFEGEQVVAITLWSNASVRLDRLSAYVSRVYWNALGDYVSESILYPILYAGWGDMADPLIKIPDPFADLEPCNSTLSLSGMSSRSKSVLVPLYSKVVEERSAAQARLALLRTRDNSVPRAPSTFTENTKTQMHAMEVARQMAQYWGRQEKVPSLCYHRQNLPRVTGISHWFSDELYDVLQTMCPSMHPARFRLLENPLVLNSTDREIGDAPKSLFPAHTLRKTDARENTDVVYDLSALPKALKGTRQSYCIMCTLPLEEPSADQLQRPASSSFRGDKTHSSSVGSVSVAAYAPSRRVDTLRKHNAGVSGHHRPSARSSLSSGGGQNQMHGLGLQGWVQGDSSQNMSPSSSNLKLQQKHYYSSHKYPYSRIGDAGQQDRRSYRLPAISERRSASSGPKKMPPQSEYKPIADPETPVLSVDEITHYSSHGKSAMVSTISWLIIWLIGGELEMVGYNVSKRLWDNVCDQIKQRLERESRRKQLLGMFASHIGGIFPGFDRQARHKGLTSTWLDRNVTRDLINKFALQKQVAMDDQIHYFNIERHLSPEYLQILGLFDGSDELEKLISNPPMADMTLNDMKTELVLRQLQSEHLRWARKLTFVDYTQPYVDTRHPDTLFRIGSRYMRAYQSRLWNVLRYDELMRVAERWRQLAVLNGLSYSMGQSARMLGVDMHTFSLNSSSHEGYSIASHASYSQMPSAPAESMGTIARRTSSEQSDTRIQAPSRRDRHEEYAASRGKGKALAATAPAVTAPAAAPPAAIAAAATSPIISKDKPASEISLDNIKMVMESARLLHFVCAPLPISSTIKPAGTDLRAFKRLFNVISAMLQNLADSYINYLCSTGYAIAKRYEKEYTWKRALESLGYPPDKIASFTRAFLGRSASTFAQIRQSVESQEESLPRIIIPSAYLFANTDRSSLVTEVEVNPEMLSIRMHALGRFTPEWRSAVPGYVRSSVNQRSIKTFTFELSKFKKLLHAKSFVYDFQLRYVTYLLRSADSLILHPFTSDQQDDQLDDRLADEFQSGAAVYSSDSENGETDNPYESAESGDSDLDEVVLPSSQMPAGSGTFENKNHKGSGGSGSRRRTVAQALHVHIDLTVFFYHLSEQRYYSTRFSSRRLVKAQFPMVHRELYEYFLDHSERYYFYAEGCRPPMQHMADNSHPNDTVPAADLCTELASHSGCYRLYEGVLPDSMHTMYGSHTFGSEPGSDPESYVWQQMAGDRSSMYHSGSHGMGSRPVYGHHADGPSPSGIPIASSAPVPTSKMEYARGKSTDNDHSGGQPHLHPFNIKGRGAHLYAGPGLTTTQSYTTGVHPRLSDHRKQMAASYAAGSKRLDIPTGHVDESRPGRGHGKQNSYGTAHFGMAATSATHHVGTNTSGYSAMYVPSPSPLYANQTAKNLLHDQQHQVSAWTDQSGRSKSLEHALSEYSMCRIHLSSNDSSVRVSLMALTPDCDSCRSENNLASQRRKERQLSHAEALNGNAENSDKKTEHHRNHRHHRHHHHHHHHRNRKHGAEEQIYTENQPDSSKACNTQNQRDQACSTRALDNISDLFSPPKSKFKLGHKHSNRLYNPHATSASATDISAPRKSIGGGIGSGSVGMSGLRSDHHHKRNVLSQSSYSGGGPEMRDDQKHRYPQQQSFKRWMASLASNIITDPEVDGLCSLDNSANGDNQGGSQAQGNPGQLSYYLIVDMDPQTTIGLSNLDINDTRSRNGSLGQLPDYLSDVYGSSDDEMSLYGMRQCSKCKHLSKEAGGFKLCGTHRVLSMFQIDMRDWENKGNVWANEPTMVMEVSAIDPDEYEKEDLDVLSWIKKTAKRIIQYTAMDYHRDLNWYRIFQHIRMADLPSYLVPDDIFELIGFVERQSSMDVGAIDEAVQQLVALDIPAEHVIRSLQLRLRHLYLEPTLLMSSLHPAPQGQQPSTDGSNSQRHCNSHMNVGGAFSRSAVAGVGTTPPSSPTAEPLPLAVTRVPTIDRQSPVCAAESRNDVSTCQPDAVTSGMNVHILPSNPLCPIAAVDAHGRIVPSKSSYNIGDVLRLLSPLETRVNRRALLDPAFQKILGRYMQLDIISSPWLCKKHRCVTSAPVQKKWSFDEAAIAEDTEDRITEQQVTQRATQGRQTDISATQSTNRRVQQVQDSDGPASSTVSGRKRAHGGRAGASISLLIGTEPLSSPSMQPQQQSLSLSMTDPIPAHSFGSTTAQKVTTDAQHNTTTAATSTPAQASTDATASGTGISGFGSTATGSADCFLRPLVEALPGSLLIIDPSGDQYIARLLLLNPFACHSMLEILFERAPDGNGARLSQIRTVARDRQRDGLYEYERKHINMVLSTVSAVVWDVMTQGDSV